MKPSKEVTELKIIFIGDTAVGKTSLIQQYKDHTFKEDCPVTLGVDYVSKQIVFEDMPLKIQLWDTAGQERFRGVGIAYYRRADSCVLVYNINEKQTFNSLKVHKTMFLDHCSLFENETPSIFLIGNKIDIDPNERQVSFEEAQEWASSNGLKGYFETSAKNSEGLVAAFKSIIFHTFRFKKRIENLDDDRRLISLIPNPEYEYDYHCRC